MQERTYAVYWSDEDGRRYAGRMALGSSFAELSGTAASGQRSLHRIFFDEIEAVGYARGLLELRRHGTVPLLIGSVDEPGALCELVDRLRAAPTSLRTGTLGLFPMRLDEALQ